MKPNLLLLAVLAGCATTMKTSEVSQPTTATIPTTSSTVPVQITTSVLQTNAPVAVIQKPVISSARLWHVPLLQLPSDAGPVFKEALSIFNETAQSEEFYDYVRKNVKVLQGGNETDVERAITKTRECFDKLGKIDIHFQLYGMWPLYKSDAIGGWDGVQINQNAKKALTSIERAGHWYHELTHACSFTHEVDGKIENNITWHPIIRQSWPYQAGYKFEDYVTFKRRVKVAGE